MPGTHTAQASLIVTHLIPIRRSDGSPIPHSAARPPDRAANPFIIRRLTAWRTSLVLFIIPPAVVIEHPKPPACPPKSIKCIRPKPGK